MPVIHAVESQKTERFTYQVPNVTNKRLTNHDRLPHRMDSVYFTLNITLTTLTPFGLALSIYKYARLLACRVPLPSTLKAVLGDVNLKGQEKQRASTKRENSATWMFLHITKKHAGNLWAQQVFYLPRATAGTFTITNNQLRLKTPSRAMFSVCKL